MMPSHISSSSFTHPTNATHSCRGAAVAEGAAATAAPAPQQQQHHRHHHDGAGGKEATACCGGHAEEGAEDGEAGGVTAEGMSFCRMVLGEAGNGSGVGARVMPPLSPSLPHFLPSRPRPSPLLSQPRPSSPLRTPQRSTRRTRRLSLSARSG